MSPGPKGNVSGLKAETSSQTDSPVGVTIKFEGAISPCKIGPTALFHEDISVHKLLINY